MPDQPVHRHQHERVDGHIGHKDDDGLVHDAPKNSKVPDRGKSIVCRGEGDAEHKKKEVRHLKTELHFIRDPWRVSSAYTHSGPVGFGECVPLLSKLTVSLESPNNTNPL